MSMFTKLKTKGSSLQKQLKKWWSVAYPLLYKNNFLQAAASQKRLHGQTRHFWALAEEFSGRIIFFLRSWALLSSCNCGVRSRGNVTTFLCCIRILRGWRRGAWRLRVSAGGSAIARGGQCWMIQTLLPLTLQDICQSCVPLIFLMLHHTPYTSVTRYLLRAWKLLLSLYRYMRSWVA